MPVLQFRSTLNAEERAQKQRLLMRDALALFILLLIVIALSFVTHALVGSFSQHKEKLQLRWKARGEKALADGQPLFALENLRSALAYAPDDRGLQIELATSLAAAGRTQEAIVYFNTLLEAQPGNGMINLQLARLAVKTGNDNAAVGYYQAAIDGVWNGDGYLRRRQTRLEVAQLLITLGRFDEARSELLIAASNAPTDYPLQLQVGGLLERAQDFADARDLYRKAAAHRETRTAGLIGVGRTAIAEGHFLGARDALQAATVQPDFARLDESRRQQVHALLDQANGILALYPREALPASLRAERIAKAGEIAQARLQSCSASPQDTPVAPPQEAAKAPNPVAAAASSTASTIKNLLTRRPQGTSADPGPPSVTPDASAGTGVTPLADPAAALAALGSRWSLLQTGPELTKQLTKDQVFAQNTMQLVYDTEKAAAQVCGAPTGKDVLLLTIANAPDQVEEQ